MSISRSRWVVLLLALVLAATVVAVWGLGTADAKQKAHKQKDQAQQTTQAQGSVEGKTETAKPTEAKAEKPAKLTDKR